MTSRPINRSNIASAINAAHAGVEAAKREGARYAVECGRLLAQAKDTVPHGGWDAWLRLNTTVSPRTAQLYMRIARHVEGDPAKAQRVAGLSVREAAAEATGPKRATAARKLLPPEGQEWLAEFDAVWSEAKDKPEWKERAARELHHRGFITREQRNSIIKAAWHNPDLTKQERAEAAERFVGMLAVHFSKDKLREMLPKFKQCDPEDIALALGDIQERRERQARGA